MIRPATREDSGAVVGLAVTAGMFPADETEPLDRMMAEYFGGNIDEGHACVIDEEQGDIRALDGLEGAQYAVFFDPWFDTTAAANPCGVDQGDGFVIVCDMRVDGISRCSGNGADNSARFTGQMIEQGRFTHIGTADQADITAMVRFFCIHGLY